MYLLTLAIIIATIVGIRQGRESYPFDWTDIVASYIVGGIAYLLLLGVATLAETEEYWEYKSVDIVSIGQVEGFSIDGSFILGTGGIHGSTSGKYVTYGKFSRGLRRIEIESGGPYLKETDSETPKIKNFYRRKVYKEIKSKWLWPKPKRYGNWNESSQYGSEPYIIIIPKNTVYKEFKLKN